jgi:hypothetical protein
MLNLDMYISAVLAAHFLLDFGLGNIEVAQRLKWLVMRR